MKTIHPRALAFALALGAFSVGACSDSTAPTVGSIDATAIQADLATLDNVLAIPQLEALAALGAYFNVGSGAPLATVSSARAMVAERGTASVLARRVAVAASAEIGARPSMDAALPPEVKGRTFVFDASQDQYVPSNRTGAPSNGVRFVLYAIDPVTGAPVVSSEIGYAELIDTGVGSQNTVGLQLRVVSGSTTYLDYAFTATGTETSATFGVAGFATDGTTRVNFDVDVSMQMAQQFVMNLTFDFSVPSKSFSTKGAVTLDAMENADATMTIVSGSQSIAYTVDATASALDATVKVNGATFATIKGPHENPTFRGASGNTLSAAEIEALDDMLGIFDEVFDFLEDVTAPLDDFTGGF